MRNYVINMSQARDKEKIPDGNWPYDFPYTGRMLKPLSYEWLVASWAMYKVHVWHALLYTVRISSSVARASDPGTEVLSRPLIFSLSYAHDMLITSFHISYNYNYYNYNYYYVQYQ